MNNTFAKIVMEWEPIISTGFLKNVILYRGFSVEKELRDNTMPSSYGYWFSEDESVAKDYAYRDEGRVPYLAKCLIHEKLVSIKFPPDYHPADVFFEKKKNEYGWDINYAKPRRDLKSLAMQPDHFIAKYWNDLMNMINPKFMATSYFRKSSDEKDLFSEVWIRDTNDFKTLSLEKVLKQ